MPDPKNLEKTALGITRAVGSPRSIVIHSVLFLGSFALAFVDIIDFDRMLLILTTIVSLEAIYLAIFIQMTINYQSQSIEEISEDVGEIQEDVEELQEDVEEISEDVEEMVEEELSDEAAEEQRKSAQKQTLGDIQTDLRRLIEDVERLKHNHDSDGTKPML